MDINLDRLRTFDDVMPANVTTIYSDPLTVSTTTCAMRTS